MSWKVRAPKHVEHGVPDGGEAARRMVSSGVAGVFAEALSKRPSANCFPRSSGSGRRRSRLFQLPLDVLFSVAQDKCVTRAVCLRFQ